MSKDLTPERDLRSLNLLPGMHAFECPECGYDIPMGLPNECQRCGATLQLHVEVVGRGEP